MPSVRLVLFSILWFVAVFAAAGFFMMGDPVQGRAWEQALLGRVIVAAGAGLWLLGFWLILRKRER